MSQAKTTRKTKHRPPPASLSGLAQPAGGRILLDARSFSPRSRSFTPAVTGAAFLTVLFLLTGAACDPPSAEARAAPPLPSLRGSANAAARAVPRPPHLDVERLLRAFEVVESGGRMRVLGDRGRSFGLFQFQRSRWRECGGKPGDWGKAGADEQRRVMRIALASYLGVGRKFGALTTEQTVILVGRCHNGGKRTPYKHTAYTKRLWHAYQTIR